MFTSRGLLLRESVEVPLLKRFEDLSVEDIEANKRKPEKPQKLDKAKVARTDPDGQPANQPKEPTPNAPTENESADYAADKTKEAREKALDQEQERDEKAREELVLFKQSRLMAAREKLDQDAIVDADLFYSLLTQQAHGESISRNLRDPSNATLYQGEEFEPTATSVDLGTNQPMVVVKQAMKDVDLQMSFDQFNAQRFLNPEEPGATDLSKLHGEVEMGFVVYDKEAEEHQGGTQYTFRFGEGTDNLPTELANSKNAEEIRKHRRMNLYKYSSDLRMNCVEVSWYNLKMQKRSLGYPLFGKSEFLKKCEYDDDILRDGDGFPVADAENMKKFHRANKYRFEVARLWYKLFNWQQDPVQREIFRQAGFLETAPKKAKNRSQSAKILSNLGNDDQIDLLERSTKQRMILSVIELGKKGMLAPGKIYPAFKETPRGDIERSENAKSKAVSDSSSNKDEKLQRGRELFVIDEDPEEPNPPYLANNTERKAVQSVQLDGAMTWPLVMPAKTFKWLDWISDSKRIPQRNQETWGFFQALFSNNLGVDYMHIWKNTPSELLNIIKEKGGGFLPPEKQRLYVFEIFSQITTDLIDAMPFWANAYLCEDLVGKEADEQAQTQAKIDTLEKQLDEELEKVGKNIKVSIDVMNDPEYKSKYPQKTRDDNEADLYNLEVEASSLRYKKLKLTTQRSSASVNWSPYASRMDQSRDREDNDAQQAKSWAHEQLMRSVTNIYVNENRSYTVENVYGQRPPRSYDRTLIVEGSSVAADWYRQWYYEVYRKLGNDGIGRVNQLVIMTNLVESGRAVLKQLPGTVQLQGHCARILERNLIKGDKLLPVYTYKLETQFHFNGTEKQKEAERKAGRLSVNDKIVVNLDGGHIWPFSYTQALRYGDRLEFEKIIPEPDDDENDLKMIALNNQIFRGEDDSNPKIWCAVELPYFGPPSVLEAYGWGKYHFEQGKSYKQAPESLRKTINSIGNVVFTAFDTEGLDETNKSVKDEYMRFPVTQDVDGNYYIQPLSDNVTIPPSLGKLNTFRNIPKGKKRLSLRVSRFKILGTVGGGGGGGGQGGGEGEVPTDATDPPNLA